MRPITRAQGEMGKPGVLLADMEFVHRNHKTQWTTRESYFLGKLGPLPEDMSSIPRTHMVIYNCV